MDCCYVGEGEEEGGEGEGGRGGGGGGEGEVRGWFLFGGFARVELWFRLFFSLGAFDSPPAWWLSRRWRWDLFRCRFRILGIEVLILHGFLSSTATKFSSSQTLHIHLSIVLEFIANFVGVGISSLFKALFSVCNRSIPAFEPPEALFPKKRSLASNSAFHIK